LAVRAAFVVRKVLAKISAAKEAKQNRKFIINDLYAQDIIQMSRAHVLYISFVIYRTIVETTEFKDKNIKPLLILLAKVFALKQLSLDCSACYETGFFGAGSKDLILDSMKVALVELRPHMIPLTELNSDELYDGSHLSSIGNKWGDIYEN